MFKVVFVIILVVGFSYLLLPYISDLLVYFGNGQNQITTILDYISNFIKTCFNALSNNTYIMTFFVVLLFIGVLFYLISYIGGKEWKKCLEFYAY